MYAEIDSPAEAPCGKESPAYLDAVLREAAACFAELASSLEDGLAPPSPLTDGFLRLLEEYLALAEALPFGAGPHRGSLAAFADGLRQTVSLRLERRRGGEELPGEELALLETAMKLARRAGDPETLAELREMARSLHPAR